MKEQLKHVKDTKNMSCYSKTGQAGYGANPGSIVGHMGIYLDTQTLRNENNGAIPRTITITITGADHGGS